MHTYPKLLLGCVAATCTALAAQTAFAQTSTATANTAPGTTTSLHNSQAAARPAAANDAGEARNGAHHMQQALDTIKKMERDPDLKAMLRQSKGVFVVPDYGRAALGVGGQGGAGVLLVHENGKWSGPGFYNLGGASIGIQAGVSGGRIAMILMDDKALRAFSHENKFSLNADAGLTVVNYSARGHGSAGRGDIVAWSDTKGLFGNVACGHSA